MAGIYIHIPFCKQACTYCNFHFSTQMHQKESFLTALKNEISSDDHFINRKEIIETIYFGGGTPSLLSNDEIRDVLFALQKEFIISSDAEITLEANPDDINDEIVKNWISSGINRLSVGIQSFDAVELKWMNRAHDGKQAIDCIQILQDSGLTNFSVDLIFGGPYLSNQSLEKSIRIISDYKIPHISCYALTLEEKTALHHLVKSKKSPPISNEKQAEQFIITMKRLAEEGYEQYEISNYAKPKMRSKHNSSYWKGNPYWGFGPSAHSFNGTNTRRWNVSNNSKFINNWLTQLPIAEVEILTDIQQLNEYIMTSIRTMDGIDLNLIEKRFGAEKKTKIESESKNFILSEKMIITPTHIILTEKGKLFADAITASLFFE